MDIKTSVELELDCNDSFKEKLGREPTQAELSFWKECFELLQKVDESERDYYTKLMGTFAYRKDRKGKKLNTRDTPLATEKVGAVKPQEEPIDSIDPDFVEFLPKAKQEEQ